MTEQELSETYIVLLRMEKSMASNENLFFLY
jgi:hypothetical protein